MGKILVSYCQRVLATGSIENFSLTHQDHYLEVIKKIKLFDAIESGMLVQFLAFNNAIHTYGN